NVNAGGGAGYVNAPAGTKLSFSIESGPGSFKSGVSECTTTDASGSCSVTITSSITGTTVVRAATNVTVGGVTLARATGDGRTGDSADAQKTWATARVSITEAGTNEVGDPHTFTVKVERSVGTGFVGASGVAIAGSTSFGSITGGTCPAGTNAAGECTI